VKTCSLIITSQINK